MLSCEQVLEEFKNREEEIKRLKKESKKCEGDLTAHRHEISEIKGQWLDPLKELIGCINENFGRFFHSMKCAGEVDLNVPENPVGTVQGDSALINTVICLLCCMSAKKMAC